MGSAAGQLKPERVGSSEPARFFRWYSMLGWPKIDQFDRRATAPSRQIAAQNACRYIFGQAIQFGPEDAFVKLVWANPVSRRVRRIAGKVAKRHATVGC